MYVREVRGQEVRFGVSGMLWRDALVFFDRKTGTLWSQVDGRAVDGPLAGERLAELPAAVMTWGEWRRLHPDTLVMRPDRRSRRGSAYERYFRDPDQMGVLGRKNPDARLPGKTLVLGWTHGEGAWAIPLDVLKAAGPVHLDGGPEPWLVVPLGDGDGRVFSSRVGDRTLRFRSSGPDRLRDEQTGSVWDAWTGEALEGPLKGRRLRGVPARRVYWFVWASFHPGTSVVGSGKGGGE